jgi:flagellar biosynthesis protein FliR
MKKTRLGTALLISLLVASTVSASPSRDRSDNWLTRIVKQVIHRIVPLDDPSWPKP